MREMYWVTLVLAQPSADARGDLLHLNPFCNIRCVRCVTSLNACFSCFFPVRYVDQLSVCATDEFHPVEGALFRSVCISVSLRTRKMCYYDSLGSVGMNAGVHATVLFV
jgi:hypothetical protein